MKGSGRASETMLAFTDHFPCGNEVDSVLRFGEENCQAGSLHQHFLKRRGEVQYWSTAGPWDGQGVGVCSGDQDM